MEPLKWRVYEVGCGTRLVMRMRVCIVLYVEFRVRVSSPIDTSIYTLGVKTPSACMSVFVPMRQHIIAAVVHLAGSFGCYYEHVRLLCPILHLMFLFYSYLRDHHVCRERLLEAVHCRCVNSRV